jgi:hypothetical protein
MRPHSAGLADPDARGRKTTTGTAKGARRRNAGMNLPNYYSAGATGMRCGARSGAIGGAAAP